MQKDGCKPNERSFFRRNQNVTAVIHDSTASEIGRQKSKDRRYTHSSHHVGDGKIDGTILLQTFMQTYYFAKEEEMKRECAP